MFVYPSANKNVILNGSFRPVLCDKDANVLAHVEKEQNAILQSATNEQMQDITLFVSKYGDDKPCVSVNKSYFDGLLNKFEKDTVKEVAKREEKKNTKR